MAKRGRKKRVQSVAPFERKARQHFEQRWRERIGPVFPSYETLKTTLREAASGKPATTVTLHKVVPPFSSRWVGVWKGDQVMLVYDHAMKLPVSCWLHKKAEKEKQYVP